MFVHRLRPKTWAVPFVATVAVGLLSRASAGLAGVIGSGCSNA